jgi:hypothetical protein
MRLDVFRVLWRCCVAAPCFIAILNLPVAAQVVVRSEHPRLLYLPDGSMGHRTLQNTREAFAQSGSRYAAYASSVLDLGGGGAHELAAKYVLTGEIGYALDAISYLTTQSLSYGGSESTAAGGVEWALAYDWTYNLMTPAQRSAVESKLRSWCYACQNDLFFGGPSEWSGRAQLVCQGWIVSLALPHSNNADVVLRNAFWNPWQDSLRAIDLSEGWPEGAGYWASNRAMFFPMAYEAWQTAVTASPPFAVSDPLRPIRRLGLWQMYTDRGDGSLERYGDVSAAADYAGNGTLPSCFDYYATVTSDPLLAAYCEYVRTVRTTVNTYYESPCVWRWSFAYDPCVPKPEGFSLVDPAGALNAVASKSEIFGKDALGLVAIRTGWGPGHTAITYKAGDYLTHHGHYDQGTFTIFKNAPLVVNMGGYGTDTGTHRLNYYVRTVGANSVLVMRPGELFPQDSTGTLANDGGQRIINATGSSVTSVDNWLANKTTGKNYDLADIRKYEHVEGQYTYVDSDLTRAYNTPTYDRGNSGGKVLKVTRQVMWLAGDEALVFFDRVISTNAGYKKKWLLHTPNKPAGGTEVIQLGSATDGLMVTDGATIPDSILTSTNSGGRLFHQVLLPTRYEVNKVGGPNYRYYVETDGNDDNGYNGSNQNGGYTTVQSCHDYGDWRIEVTPKTRQLDDTFLNVLWARDAATASVPVSRVLRNDAAATVLQAGSAVVGFGTCGAVSADVSYSLDAAGATTHRLVDLAAEATVYWVLCGDSSLQQVQASPRGVLQFTDPVIGEHPVKISADILYLPTDGNRDGGVDVIDLLFLVTSWGTSAGDPAYDARYDFNGDGSIDVVDLLTLVFSFGASQVPQGTYSRGGTAYMDGAPYAPDVPRIRTMPVASRGDLALMNSLVYLSDAAAATSLTADCTVGDALIVRNSATGHVYGYTGDGVLPRLTSVAPGVMNVLATNTGTLVGFCPSIRGFKRSTDGGRTWSVSAMIGGDANGFTSNTSTLPYSCIEAAGCLWAGEYSLTAPYPAMIGRYVWRSRDDGITWQPVLDGAVVQPDPALQWSHIHGIAFHGETGRLVVAAGDGVQRAQVWYTGNPSAVTPTWVKMRPGWGEERAQPMAMLDFGDPTRLLFGDDENRGLGYLDVVTGTVTNAMPVTDGRFPHNLYWDVVRVDDVYYALSADSSSAGRMQAVLASADGIDWVVYCRLPADYNVVRWFGGRIGGRLHLYCSAPDSSYQWLSLPPARLENREAVLLEPGVTNLIAGSAGHFDDDSHGWTCAGHVVSRDLTDGCGPGRATACLKVTASSSPTPGTTAMTVLSPLIGGLTDVTQYGGSVWMRTTAGSMLVIMQMKDEAGSTGPQCQYFVDTTWREYRTLPLPPGTQGSGRVRIQMTAYPTPGATELRIDNAQLAALPITQVQYVPPRSDDSWEYAKSVGDGWTNTFTIAPEVLAWQLQPGGRLLVRRWQSDAGNYIDLVYTIATQTFDLSVIVDGVEAGAATSPPVNWPPASRLRFSVCVSQNRATLMLSDGGRPSSASLTVDPSLPGLSVLLRTTLTIKAFSPGGDTCLFPHYLFPGLDTWG